MVVNKAITFKRPYYWANRIFSLKHDVIKNSDEVYNTYFFGSSHVYRHIDPVKFDLHSNDNTKSFNFATGSTRSEESIYLIENLLKDDKIRLNTKYIFIELAPINYTKKVKTYYASRHWYYLNLETVWSSLKEKRDIKRAYKTLCLLGLKHICFNNNLFDRKAKYCNKHIKEEIKLKHGYVSLDTEYKIEIEECEPHSLSYQNHTLRRRKEFKKLISQNGFNAVKKDIFYNRDYDSYTLDKIIALTKNEDLKHIEFIITMPLKSKSIPIAQKIEGISLLGLTQNQKEKLVTQNQMFDRGHFNDKGSKKYTQVIASNFNKR